MVPAHDSYMKGYQNERAHQAKLKRKHNMSQNINKNYLPDSNQGGTSTQIGIIQKLSQPYKGEGTRTYEVKSDSKAMRTRS
jgi:NRPS condensation-like uncharacterized protein